MRKGIVAIIAALVGACGAQSDEQTRIVKTSGKSEVDIAQVPSEVLAAATSARTGFTPSEATQETREGRRYFDIEGTLADGSEIEFDIMEADGRWRVVETQRDIAYDLTPRPVREVVKAKDAGFLPARVIESSQQDGIVIYELFSPKAGDPLGLKVEVRWDGKQAAILTEEWAH